MFAEEIANVRGHFSPINSVAFSPDGTSFVTGAEEGNVRLHHFDADYFTTAVRAVPCRAVACYAVRAVRAVLHHRDAGCYTTAAHAGVCSTAHSTPAPVLLLRMQWDK